MGRFFPYEDFEVRPDMGGGYIMRLTTNILIHRKHTAKNRFQPHSVFQAAWFSDKPTDKFINDWLPRAREAAHKLINKGEYTDEELISGEFQSIKRKYNKWVMWDRQNRATASEFKSIPAPQVSNVGGDGAGNE